MKIKCSNCKKNFDMEKYYGICPKCGAFNRPTTSAQQHQEYHNMYDNGYDHSEKANHQVHHDRYDNGYNHSEPHNRTTNNNVDRYSPYKNVTEVDRQKSKIPFILKLIIIIFIFNFVITFLFSFFSIFASFSY